MALSILDGNQSATTLSTILSSGQHITAHTVVSLGTQAITDMRGAVSGSVVSISNLPSTQTIAGTVTANAGGDFANSIENVNDVGNVSKKIAVQLYDDNGSAVGVAPNPLPISGTVTASISGTVPVSISSVTVGNSVTIGSLPAISGTVTANVFGKESFENTFVPIQIGANGENFGNGNRIGVALINESGIEHGTTGTPFNISGTVTVGNSVTIGSLPAISGTVTANTFALQGTAVTTSNFTSTTASTVLANYNATREVLTIFNEGAGNLHICAGATCTTIAYQVRLSAGDYYEVPNHQTTITHSAVFATAGTARVCQVS